jgi:hypothetical protein
MSADSEKKSQLGKILLKQRLITPDELERLLAEQKKRPGSRLASSAAQRGSVADAQLLQALSEQHQLPGVDLAQLVVPLGNLLLVPEEIAKAHVILPILVKEHEMFLAMADPSDRKVIEEIEYATGKKVVPYVALHESLCQVIEHSYRLATEDKEYFIGPFVSSEHLSQLGLRPAQPADAPAPRPATLPPHRPAPALSPSVVVFSESGTPYWPGLEKQLHDQGVQVKVLSPKDGIAEALHAHMPRVVVVEWTISDIPRLATYAELMKSPLLSFALIVVADATFDWRIQEDVRSELSVYGVVDKLAPSERVASMIHRAVSGAPSDLAEEQDVLAGPAEQALAQGMQAYQQGQLEQAIASLHKALTYQPSSFRVRYNLGLLYGQARQPHHAIEQLEFAVRSRPKHFSSLRNLAILYQNLGFKWKAMELWERSLHCAPDDDLRASIRAQLMVLLADDAPVISSSDASLTQSLEASSTP